MKWGNENNQSSLKPFQDLKNILMPISVVLKQLYILTKILKLNMKIKLTFMMDQQNVYYNGDRWKLVVSKNTTKIKLMTNLRLFIQEKKMTVICFAFADFFLEITYFFGVTLSLSSLQIRHTYHQQNDWTSSTSRLEKKK